MSRVAAGQRSLKLGATAVGAFVLLPALKYPPNPPTVGSPATIGQRTTLYLGLLLVGLVLACAAWAAGRQLAATTLPADVRQVILSAGVLAVAAAVVVALPPFGDKVGVPATLLWSFRLASIAGQVTLWAGTAVVFGLLAARTERSQTASPG